MKKPELLAPAGGSEHFAAAVENGADAIYFGGKLFNARQSAINFEAAEMSAAISYAHRNRVKAYMALNTLIRDDELKEGVKQAFEGVEAGVDALIVQDMGLARLIKKELPEIPLHLSTQGTVYDLSGVRFARENGFKRVVLAREMRLSSIVECSSEAGIETEVFAHGALCMCLSGQCSMSSLAGERSGNRGSCAQPCRLSYALETRDGVLIGDKGYLLSPRDISYLGELDKIIKAGVTSLKIEGRLKSPEYVALTVKNFRKYIDQVCKEKNSVQVESSDWEALQQMFCRGGFTKGYLYEKQNYSLLSGDSPKHTGLYLGNVRKVRSSSVSKEKSVIEVSLKRAIALGDGIEILCKGFPGGVISLVKGKNGNVKKAEAGESVWLGDIPGIISQGAAVYKVSDKAMMQQLRGTYQKRSAGKIPVTMTFKAKVGDTVDLEVRTGAETDSKVVVVKGEQIVQVANNRPTDMNRIREQLAKTGETPYELANCTIIVDDNIMIPISEINKVRREALERLNDEG